MKLFQLQKKETVFITSILTCKFYNSIILRKKLYLAKSNLKKMFVHLSKIKSVKLKNNYLHLNNNGTSYILAIFTFWTAFFAFVNFKISFKIKLIALYHNLVVNVN